MLSDMRLAIRRFWRKPGHFALMIVIVGVGIGAATAVFSVVDQTILRPPPFAHADRLVQVMDLYRSAGARSTNLTREKIAGWQGQRALFEAFEGYTFREVDLTGGGLEPERVRGRIVTNGLLRMLGVQPSHGRGFAEDDGRPERERVVIISDGLWKRKFGARADVLGMRIALSDEQHTIIGIMPRRFRIGGDDEDLWLPFDVTIGAGAGRAAPRSFVGLARLAPGVDASSRQKLADTLAARLQEQQPLPSSPFWDIHLAPKQVATVTDTTQTALFVLLGAVGFVLLITCANTASLLLTQVGVRQRETAIRAAIGASRGRLFREVLTESVLLAAAGGAVGILLASWGVDAIVAAAPPDLAYNTTGPIEVDGRVLAAAAGATVVTGVLFGLLPAFRGSSPNVDMILKSGAGGSPGRTANSRFVGGLLVAEVAVSLILLVGAALMVRTFVNLHGLNPGFDSEGVVAVTLSLPTDKYVGEGSRSAFFDSLRDRLVAVPGVSDVAVAAGVFGGAGMSFGKVEEIDGRAPAAAHGRIEIGANNVTGEYFRTLRVPIVAGRTFSPTDQQDAVIVSKSLADRLWPNGGAVGSHFRLGAGWPWETVVGVVGDLEPRAGDQRSTFHLYRPFLPPAAAAGAAPRARGYAGRTVLVRTTEPALAIPAIRAAVWSMDANQPLGRVARVADIYADSFARERFVLQLMAVFGLIAVALTAAGIFGVLSQIVARRTRELGLRMALGARGVDIVRLVASRGVLLVATGVVFGLGGALGLTRFLEALLFQVRPVDPLSFAVVTALIGAVALLACWSPARRAMRVDPAEALRVE